MYVCSLCIMKESQDNTKATEGSQNSSLFDIDAQPQGSMESLVVWNLSKALERNRFLNFQDAIKELQNKMEHCSRELTTSVFEHPQERYLACALLAWQQLHRSSESLIRFAESTRYKLLNAPNEDVKSEATIPESSDECDTASILQKQSFLMGPVVTLPVHTKVVMRVEKTTTNNKAVKPTSTSQNVMRKLEAAGGCVELGCVAKLKELDRGTSELRARASKLSKREAERAELLERAEMAWRELEVGFQRRLRLADEKEEQLAMKIETLIEERKEHKQTCVDLIAKVKEKADALEKRKQTMQKCEEEVCGLACLCHQLNEEALAVDTALADASAKYHQLDRECQFKEGQAQRRVKTLRSQLESAQQFTLEAELAMRAELGALRDQLDHVSAQLLKKDEKNERLRGEIEELNTVKITLVEDLEECNRACDLRLQGKLAELKEKKAELLYARENALKCTCHVPVETSVEAKRTPSLAALCCCPPGRHQNEDACSCTSLRTKLLNDLLVELFAGLRFELGDTLNSLPCQILKCLEDEHNWDMASALKNSLLNFFSKLLLVELDIAISTSIESYHAKWVGGTCADSPSIQGGGGRGVARFNSQLLPTLPMQAEHAANCSCWTSGMKERVEELAAQMFDKRVKELNLKATSRDESSLDTYTRSITDPNYNRSSYEANNKVPRGSRNSDERDPSVLYCHVPQQKKSTKEGDALPVFLKRTHNDVTQLRAQIEDLKKETIKKTDLKIMEENIVKLLQNVARPVSISTDTHKEDSKDTGSPKMKSSKNVSLESTIKVHNYRNVHIENTPRNFIDMNKNMLNYKKRPIKDFSPPKRLSKLSVYSSGQLNKTPQKVFKKYAPSYAVNVCLCPDPKELPSTSAVRQDSFEVRNMNMADPQPQWAQLLSPDLGANQEAFKDDLETALKFEMELMKEKEQSLSAKQIPRHENSLVNVDTPKPACLTDCLCVNKLPSTSSVVRLLDVLNKWKEDLYNSTEVVDKSHAEMSQTKALIVKNSEKHLDSNRISINNLKKNSLHSSNNTGSHSTNRLQNSNKGSIHSANKAMTQNFSRVNLPLINKAVNSPTRLSSNIMDMKEISEIPELETQSKKSQYTYCKDRDSLVDSNKELLLIVSNSQLTLDKDSNSNRDNLKRNRVSDSEFTTQKNFDKSLKGLCRCSDSYESRCKCATDSNEDKTKLQYQNPSRGTEAHAYDFKEDSVKLNVKSNISDSQADVNNIPCFDQSNCKQDKSQHSIFSPLSMVDASNGEPKDSFSYKIPNKCNESDSNIKELLKNSEDLSYDYDYSVNFLGVTLNKFNQEPDIESSILNDVQRYKDEFFLKTNPKKTNFTYIPRSKIDTNCRKNTDQVASCPCYDKFEDLKIYFNELLTNCKTVVVNQDKSFDTQSFNENSISKSKDFCLCSEESSSPYDDLELNTFELIKDHLKSKLQELKLSSCKFTCVPYEEEEKLLTAILLKVKQVISDSTKHSCKCSDINKTEGSWNRAYCLLQEYLKTKIKRVQCVCSSASKLKENVILPDVLDKVCHLIENDFDRLKNICRMNDTEHTKFEIPTKEKTDRNSKGNVAACVRRVDVIKSILPDLNNTNKVSKEVSTLSISQNHKQISKQSFLRNHKEISQQSFLKTENMYTQVSKKFADANMHVEKIIKGLDNNLELTCYFEDIPKTIDFTKLSHISNENLKNERAVLDLNDKSECKISLEQYTKFKPNFGESKCNTSIRSHLSEQKEGEQIVKSPHSHVENQLYLIDSECDTDKPFDTSIGDEIMLKQMNIPVTNENNGPSVGALSARQEMCKHYHQSLAGLASRLNQMDNDPLFHPIEYPVFQEKVQNAKTEMFRSLGDPEKTHTVCDCSLIPLCHVKMLVENIEDKLANSKCICDSFSSNVCPIHSRFYK